MPEAKAEATGVLRYNLMVIDDTTREWIDSPDFTFAKLAREIGVGMNRNVKAKVTLELVLEPCLFCGAPTTGDHLCEECQIILCEKCAKTHQGKRLCPKCYNKQTQTTQPTSP